MKKLLIVDDEADTLYLLKGMLELHDFEVKTVSSGKNVLQTVMDYQPDVVLMDICLDPPYKGTEICMELKTNMHTQDTKVILFSAYIEKNKLNRSKEDAFIQKPFRVKELVLKIKKGF